MYACLHMPAPSAAQELLDIALEFSPYVEQTAPSTLVFSIDPLRKLLGSPYQIASEHFPRRLRAQNAGELAIASNPDTAFCWRAITRRHARSSRRRSQQAGAITFGELAIDRPCWIFARWGVKTCEELAALPEAGVAER